MQRVRGVRGDRARVEAGREVLRRPVDEHPDRQHERERDDAAAERERRPAPAPEPHRRGRALRAGARAMQGARPAHARVQREQHEHHDDEDHAERRRLRPLRRLKRDVDLARERVEAQDRDGAEVAQDVERHEHPARPDRRRELRQDDRAEDLERRAAHDARGLLERRVEAAQRGAQRDQHERVRAQREHEPRSGEAVDRRQLADAERREQLLQQALRAQHRDEHVRRDVARHDERQRRERRPAAAAGQVRADRQPGERDGDRDRPGGDGRGQPGAADDEAERAAREHRFGGDRAVARDDDDEVQRRQRRRHRDGEPEREQQRRGAAGAEQPRRPPRGPGRGRRVRHRRERARSRKRAGVGAGGHPRPAPATARRCPS